MKQNFGNKITVGLLIASSSFGAGSLLWAKNTKKNRELAKEVQKIDLLSTDYNAQPKTKLRVASLLAAFEKFMGRAMTTDEKKFLNLEFASLAEMPRFELSNDSIQVYEMDGSSKNVIVNIEIVDAQKHLFKYKGKVFQLNPDKPLHENIQFILRELQAGEEV